MTRMGKPVPESRPTPAPAMSSVPKKTTTNTASASTSALKKVYCTPKINFVGEIHFLYMYEHRYDILMKQICLQTLR